jgi:DNA-binding transcriptional LysR family regulator
MPRPDLNLLVLLDVLLEEGSVTRAGRRLRLSPSATSRALARLRRATGDPLLVRAGRGLVLTPRAVELRQRVRHLVQDAEAALSPVQPPDLATLSRTFTLRTSDGFVENFGAELLARVGAEAPGVRLHFLQKTDKQPAALRDGTVDLETGVLEAAPGPDIRTRTLFRDRFVGVVRPRHPLATGTVTPDRYAAGRHIRVSRQPPLDHGLIDHAAAAAAQAREVVVVVGGFAAALALARGSDLIATVPDRHTAALRVDLHAFALPFPTPRVTVSLLWHARLDADPAHRWLRAGVMALFAGPAEPDRT